MKARLALWSCLLRTTHAVHDVVAQVNGVTYHGIYRDHVETFLGIRYGQDTSGSNRFRPPRPYSPPEGSTFHATEGGPSCPQELGAVNLPLYLQNVTEISEDCLRLNVIRPNCTAPDSKLPVMVYIHGGSFITGSKDDPVTQPGGLILESIKIGHPIIHVSINYRLGIFGFAKSGALRTDGSENPGLRDQRLALEWVSKNIHLFGGDRYKITIHGQSSGGASMGWQILAYGGRKKAPFQQIITQSQVAEAGITGNLTRNAMARVANATGCNDTDLESAETVECLRSLTLDELLRAQTETHKEDASANIGDEWLPSVDGDFLPAAPTELIHNGNFSKVDAIIGWCEDDANIIVSGIPLANDSDVHKFVRAVLPGFSGANIRKLEELYPASDFHDSYHPNGSIELPASFYRGSRIFRDLVFACQPFLVGDALIKAGNNVYYYNQNQTVLTPILESLGLYGYDVVHTAELAYVFGNFSHFDLYGFEPNPSASDFELKTRESRSWSAFAAVGKPSIPGKKTLGGWEKARYGSVDDVYVVGGENGGYAGEGGSNRARKLLEMQKLKERCGFLNSDEILEQLLW